MSLLFLRAIHGILSLPLRFMFKVEKILLLRRFRSIGKNFSFVYPGSIFSAEKICIGDHVYIGEWAWLSGPITIGNRVMFGPRPTIAAGNHLFAIHGKSPRFIIPAYQGQNDAPVIIEDDVWIGANVTILGGVTIGIGSVIGAGSVVSKDVCPFTISVGNPCKPVRKIFEDEQLLGHLLDLKYSQEFARNVVDKRKQFLSTYTIPVIDNTDDIAEFAYHSP
jgi:acetyltransferase-like isoleucine patch superfamily enzyme